MNGNDAVAARLSGYWRMEAANVVLVPAAMVMLSSGQLGLLSMVAIIPMSLMLIVGAAYWRAKHLQITARHPMAATVRWIAAIEPLMIASTAAAIAATLVAWVHPASTQGSAERWVITVAATLAALEYVNYYHRQLQHFDRMADWRRLRAGRGFRKSKLRHDLEQAGLRGTGR